MNRTHGDELFGSVLSAPTNVSINDEENLTKYMNRTVMDGGAFLLPSITQQTSTKNASPFQGFLDVSIVN